MGRHLVEPILHRVDRCPGPGVPRRHREQEEARQEGAARRGGRPVSHDADLYKGRNTAERLIDELKTWRGTATRRDRTPESYLAGRHLRASMIWADDPTNDRLITTSHGL